jgi:hypothetical protein
MLSFKQYIVEYLTDEQRAKYAYETMSDKARKDTDHFFGKDNDIVHGHLDASSGHMHDKSEVHKAVERHLGKEIDHKEYTSGITKDKYNRDVKIGRVIKDAKLKDQFASDTARQGAKKGSSFTTSTVRGVEVAGQTNSATNKEHPKGHSWGELSCKNIDNGENKHFLRHEIHHGTVVHRVHDHAGQEIYRGTLQPHHNEHGDTSYHLNSEYGIKHPAFTKSAHDAAKKLSGEYKPGVFHIHRSVYNDDRSEKKLHPNAKPEHISKALDDEDWSIRHAAMNHPNVKSEHISKALNDKNLSVRQAAISHPNATPEHISKALNDAYRSVKKVAAAHPNVTSEHIFKALDDKDDIVRINAIKNRNATSEHISKALNDSNINVRYNAIKHPNATPEHISKALDDEDEDVRNAAKHMLSPR